MTDTNPPADRIAEKCDCYWTDPSTWTTHYGAAEPGSQREWNPECPEHGHATEIRARIKAATPGPWTTGSRDDSGNLYIGQAEPGGALVATAGDGDAELIAHAPFDLAYLLARVGELEEQIAKGEEEWAIRVFTRADHGHWFHQHADADTFDEDLAVALSVAANSIDLSTGAAPVNHGVAVVKRTVRSTEWETVKSVEGTGEPTTAPGTPRLPAVDAPQPLSPSVGGTGSRTGGPNRHGGAQAGELIPADLIESNPDIRGGEPCMKGTRVPAADVAGLLADGIPWHAVHEFYPGVPLPEGQGCGSMVACGCHPDRVNAAKAAHYREAAASLRAIADHVPDTSSARDLRPGIHYAATLLNHTADDHTEGETS